MPSHRQQSEAERVGDRVAAIRPARQIEQDSLPWEVDCHPAEQLELIDAQHLAVWRGDVDAVRGTNRLRSDILNIIGIELTVILLISSFRTTFTTLVRS